VRPRRLTVVSGPLGAGRFYGLFAALCRLLGVHGGLLVFARVPYRPFVGSCSLGPGCSHVFIAAFGRFLGVLRSFLIHSVSSPSLSSLISYPRKGD